jgi:hypothetical protein
LDHPDSFSNFETLSDLEGFCFDLDRFVLFGHEMDIAILDVVDNALAVFELALEYFDPVSYLNLELRVISDGFHEGFVVEKIPLILILILELIEV